MTAGFSQEENFGLLSDAVLEAGKLALRLRGKSNLKSWLKDGNEPVTEVDIKVNDYLKQALSGKRPAFGWLSEESADDLKRLEQKHVWVVDPIDGTRALLQGGDDFSISVALLENNIPVLGAIYSPAMNRYYLAQKAGGATLNNQTIKVSDKTAVEGMRLQGDEFYFNRPARWQNPWVDITLEKYKSFALRLAAVAEGEFDAAISASPKSEWDIAAGDLIIREAGGVCCDGAGEAISFNNKNTRVPRTIATTPALKGQILKKLAGRIPKNTS